MRTAICSKCGIEQDWHKEFNRNRAAKGGRLSYCRTCKQKGEALYRANDEVAEKARQRTRQYYNDNKEKVREYEANRQMNLKIKAIAVLGGKCQECDMNHPAALQFHHRDPSTKSFEVTTKVLATPKLYPWETILEEISKCDLLCANHHAIRHNRWPWQG